MASRMTSGEEAVLKKLAGTLREHKSGLPPLEDITAAHTASLHLLAQQIAFFSRRQPNPKFKENYLKNTFNTLSELVIAYEKELQPKKGSPEYVKAVHQGS